MFKLFQNLWQYHYVVKNFVARDLKVKYRGTILGYFWSLLEPLSLVGIYYFVFVVIAKRGGPDYPLIVILGVLPYNYMNLVIAGGANSLAGNASLIRRVYLPRELFVVSLVGSNFVVLLLSLLVCVPFLFLYEVAPTWRLIFLPAALLLLTLFATGVALVASCANALYRDVAYIIRVVLRLSFYGSPVIYSLDMVPERLRELYMLNPISIYLSMCRSSVMGTDFAFGPEFAAYGVSMAILVFWLGATLFQRWQNKAVKFL